MRACEQSIKRLVRRIPRVVDAAERRRLYALDREGVADPIRPRARTSRARTLDEQRQLDLSRELVDELTKRTPPPNMRRVVRA